MRTKQKLLCLVGLVFSIYLFFPVFAAAENEEEEKIRVNGIRVHQDALTLSLGETDQVTVTVYPGNATDKTVYWKLSDPQIVDMTDLGHTARINALAPGTTVLTAITRDGGFYDSCTITAIVLVRTLVLETTQLTLSPGEEFQLDFTIEPPDATDQRISWESTEPIVAVVNEAGLVTALQEGETRIIARSMQDELISAYANLTVVPEAPEEEEDEEDIMPAEPEPETETDQEKYDINWLLTGGLIAVLLVAALAVIFFLRRRK